MPADYSTENGKVRYNIGDITEPYLIADVVIDAILTKYVAETEEVRIYKTTVECLYILKGMFATEADRKREKEGNVELDYYYTKRYERLLDLLEDWENNPPVEEAGQAYAGLFFGGVSKTEKARVENDTDSVLPGAKITTFDDKISIATQLADWWRIEY